jgi:hypothetical protein
LWGQSHAVHNSVRHPFDILVLAFSRILMLLMGFTLPIANDEGPEDILDSATDFDLGTVADKLGGSAMTSNYILQGVDKCLFGFRGYTSQTVEVSPTKSWAIVTPESTAGTSECTVRVASASSQRWTFNERNGNL